MPNDPDFSPFRALAAAVESAEGAHASHADQEDALVTETVRRLLTALQPFTPAQLDAMLWPMVAGAREMEELAAKPGPRCRDPHCRDCGPRTLGGLAAGQPLRVDPRIGM